MKKIVFVLLVFTIPSFAVYFDIGIGVGGADTEVEDVSISDICDTDKECNELAVDFSLRVGGQVSEKFWIAGELSGIGNRYYDSDYAMQFNSYLLGPSFIFYPVKNLHLSGSLGVAWTSNESDYPGLDLLDGSGAGMSLTVAFDTGGENGALIGLKMYSFVETLEETKAELATVGATIFVSFVHK